MTPEIILVTHPGIASCLLQTAGAIMNGAELKVHIVEIPMDEDFEISRSKILELIERLNNKTEILILNDICGATPFNVARSFISEHIKVLSGVNMNMLLRAITYQALPLDQLVEKAREGGINGVRLNLE